jgi:hypothetical protein
MIRLFLAVATMFLNSGPPSAMVLAADTNKPLAARRVILEEAIRMRQTHFFMGEAEVTIAAKGIRIENISQLKYVLVAKAPQWRVYVFRNDDKTYFDESLKDFEQTGLMSNFLFPFKDPMLGGKRYEPALLTMNGFKVIQLSSSYEKLKYMNIVTLPQQVKRIMYVAYKLPTNGGIPISYERHQGGVDIVTGFDRKNEIEIALNTTTIKHVKVSPQEFELPPQLNRTNSMREVVAGNKTRTQSDDEKALLGM